MALSFPASPSDGDVFTNATTGVKYIYNDADGVWKTHVWPTNTDYLQLSGGTLTGNLSLGTNDLTAQDITTTGAVSVGTGLTVGNGITVTAGNVVMSSGAGINFAASTDGSGVTIDSELLDEYEYGTFTPTLSGVGSASDYNQRDGAYTKIGDVVTFTIFIAIQTNTPSAVTMVVSGLPFASRSGYYHAFGRGWNNNWTGSADSIQWLMAPGSTEIGAYYAPASGAVSSQQSNVMGTTGNFILTGSYLTS